MGRTPRHARRNHRWFDLGSLEWRLQGAYQNGRQARGDRAGDAARTCKNTMDDWSRDSRGLRWSARRCRLPRRAEKIRSHLQRESIDRDGGERPSGAHASRRPCEAEEAVASRGPTHRGHGVRREPRLEPEIGARARHGAKSHRPPCVMLTPPGRQDRDPALAVAQIGTKRLEILRRAGKLVRRRRRCLGLPSPNPRTNRARAPTPSPGESTANQRLDLCWEEGTRTPRVYVPTTEVRGR